MKIVEALILTLILMLALACFSDAKASPEQVVFTGRTSDSTETNKVDEYHILNLQIRDNKIDKLEALAQLTKILQYSKQMYYEQSNGDTLVKPWIFPLQNYNYLSIGGRNGSGYIVSHFDYFDMTTTGGHPAQDIFIKDKNQDTKDDITLKPVSVLSVTSGIVLDTENCWTSDSIWKGGKYIHIYDPVSKSIFYYAHNDSVMVKAGDIVKQGDSIAFVGRTGLRAYAKRSPTHLHFAQLKLDETGYPRPVNPYKALVKSKSIYITPPKH